MKHNTKYMYQSRQSNPVYPGDVILTTKSLCKQAGPRIKGYRHGHMLSRSGRFSREEAVEVDVVLDGFPRRNGA